jgi:hypothetical protein
MLLLSHKRGEIMALFPGSGTRFYDDRDRDIQQRMEDFYQDSITINQAFWGEADIDTRFEAGDQQVFSDIYGNLPFNRRKSFNFNRIRRVVNMISGHQRKNRMSTTVVPVENADEQTADQFTKILSWCNQQEGVLNTISDSFHGALVTGMNLLQVWVDYRSDPVSGNIKVDNCSYNSFLIDPYFRKKDLSDCNSIWKRSYMTKREVVSILPDYKEEIMRISGMNAKDGKFQFMPENYDLSRKNLLAYDEFYYRDQRTQQMLVDSETGESIEWRGKDEDSLREFLRLYPQVTVIDQEIPTVKMAVVVQGKVFYDGINPMGTDRYPFVPVFGYYNPQLPDYSMRIQGVVRGLRDPQFLYNRRKVIELDIAESKATTGYIAKENAAVDPKDLFKTGQGRTIFLKETAQMSDIQPIPTQDVPQSFFQMSEILGREVQEISGVNDELLGSAIDDKAGILSMLRQGAGLTTLQILFDQLDYSQKLLGKLMIDIVQSNFTPGKIKRIIEQEPSPQFYNKAFGKYDAAVEEGLNTTTQRQLQFAQLLQLRETGVPIPDHLLLKASTIQNKKELTDAIMQDSEKRAQMEQMQLKITLEEQQARTNLANARAVADKGLGMERVSRIEENQELAVERRAEAQKDRTQGILNLVKSLQEIDDVDIAQIQKLLALAGFMRSSQEKKDTVSNQRGATSFDALSSLEKTS